MDTHDHETSVKDYYDENTPAFTHWEGERSRPLAIHRRVWAPEVKTIRQSLDWAHEALIPFAETSASVVDWGCGSGAGLHLLSSKGLAAQLMGRTLSPLQAHEAQRWLGSRAEIKTGSYLDPSAWPETESPCLYYAIESLVHCADPTAFRDLLDQKASSGDHFALCDDFQARPPLNLSEEHWLKAFTTGWRAPRLETFDHWDQDLRRRGWNRVLYHDASLWIDQGGFWRRLASRAAVRFPARPGWSANLRGGAALVLGYATGLFSYRLAVWKKL